MGRSPKGGVGRTYRDETAAQVLWGLNGSYAALCCPLEWRRRSCHPKDAQRRQVGVGSCCPGATAQGLVLPLVVAGVRLSVWWWAALCHGFRPAPVLSPFLWPS